MNEPIDPNATQARIISPQFPEAKLSQLRSARFRAQITLVIVESLLLTAAFVIASSIYYFGTLNPPSAYYQALQIVPFYAVVAIYQGVYLLDSLRNYRTAIARIAIALLIAISLRLFMTFVAKTTGEFSRAIFIMAMIMGFLSIAGLRWVVIRTMRRNFGDRLANILVIDAGGPPVPLDKVYRVNAREYHFEPNPADPDMLDRFGRIARNMDRVIVSCPFDDRPQWSLMLKGLNAAGELISGQLHEMGAVRLARHDDFTTITVSTGPLGLRDRILKRLFDLAITLPSVLLLSPLLGVVALLIKLEDGGPVFFRQDRMGRANCTFKILKFRSMKVEGTDARGDQSASKDDARVTRIGSLIRRTSIDELPQLLNVIKGDMSLVGPRPHALGSRAGGKLFWEIDPTYWHRHALKPGLTGLAQVRGHRGATESEAHLTDRLQADLEYLSSWSLWQDLLILLRTARVLIHDRAF